MSKNNFTKTFRSLRPSYFLKFGITFLAANLFSACSSTPSITDRYISIDSDRKIAFLAYYPDLTPVQRDELLDPYSDSPRNLIKNWNVTPSRTFDDVVTDPRSHTITNLEIKPVDSQIVVKSGHAMTFKAIAHYADQREADVTSDAVWKATPDQVDIKKGKIQFGCLHSEGDVSANFLNEQQGSVPVEYELPIHNLELRISDSYLAANHDFGYQLTVIAHCEDGSTADVSCQATYKSESDFAEVTGCGNLTIGSPDKDRHKFNESSTSADPLRVSAQYGGTSVSRELSPPQR
jgi:hypothetical protein